MRKVLALAGALAASIALAGCGQPTSGASSGTGSRGGPVASTAVVSSAAIPVVGATGLSSGDFGDVSGWVAEPGNFGPIGAAAQTAPLVAAGYAVSRLVAGCPFKHVFASPALAARGVSFGDVSEGRLHGIFYSAKVRTAKGIHEGSSAADLAKAYGGALIDTPWRWNEGGADTRAKVLFDADGALIFLMGPRDSVAGMWSAAGSTLDDVDLAIGGGC